MGRHPCHIAFSFLATSSWFSRLLFLIFNTVWCQLSPFSKMVQNMIIIFLTLGCTFRLLSMLSFLHWGFLVKFWCFQRCSNILLRQMYAFGMFDPQHLSSVHYEIALIFITTIILIWTAYHAHDYATQNSMKNIVQIC